MTSPAFAAGVLTKAVHKDAEIVRASTIGFVIASIIAALPSFHTQALL